MNNLNIHFNEIFVHLTSKCKQIVFILYKISVSNLYKLSTETDVYIRRLENSLQNNS